MNIVAVSFDDNYTYPFFVLAFSLKKNATNNFKLIIANINNTISLKNINLIQEFSKFLKIEIEIIDFELELAVQIDEKISIPAYGRFFLMESMKQDFLYLDVDSIAYFGWDQFLESSIESRGESCAVQATIEPKSFYFKNQPRFLKNQARQRAGDRYLFSGLLIINVEKLREVDFSSKWRESALNYSKLGFMQHDQDVLNYVLSGFVEPLSSNVNHLHGKPKSYPKYFSSCIGSPKPWTISIEEQKIITGLWSLGSKDIGKSFWVEDFYDYWSYENALTAEFESKKQLSNHLRWNYL